jgi:hypothetical protein
MNLFWDPTPAPDPERTQPDEDRMLSGLGSGGSTGARPLLLLQLPGGAKIRLHSLEERARARARAARVLQRTIQPGGQHEPPLQQVTATTAMPHRARSAYCKRSLASSRRRRFCARLRLLSRRAKALAPAIAANASLTSINLGFNNLGPDGAKALARSFRAVRACGLGRCDGRVPVGRVGAIHLRRFGSHRPTRSSHIRRPAKRHATQASNQQA